MNSLSPHHVRAVLLAALASAAVLVALVIMDPGRLTTVPAASSAPTVAPEPAATAGSQLVSDSIGAGRPAGARSAGASTSTPAAGSASADADRTSGGLAPAAPALLADIGTDMEIRSEPGGGRVIGTMPARSQYLGTALSVWVMKTTADHRYGLVVVPWARSARVRGWIRLRGLYTHTTPYLVRASLSRREIVVEKLGQVVLRRSVGVGASSSPSPTGRFFVTDRVVVPASQPQFGSFAFGLSGIQPHPPPGWTGGNQMAIHGTSDPGSIGQAASAGCLRVSEETLQRLRPLLRLGTPVVIEA